MEQYILTVEEVGEWFVKIVLLIGLERLHTHKREEQLDIIIKNAKFHLQRSVKPLSREKVISPAYDLEHLAAAAILFVEDNSDSDTECWMLCTGS